MYFSNEIGQYNNINFYTPWEINMKWNPRSTILYAFFRIFFFLRIHLKILFILEKYQVLYDFFFDVPKIPKSGLWYCKRQCKWRRILKWVLCWSRLIKQIQVTIGLSFVWPLYVFVYILRHNILLQIIKIRTWDIWIAQK